MAPLERAGTLERAVASAAERAVAGETVLLSPACSSFDQFQNFAERGRVFQDLVRALGPTSGPPGAREGGELGTQAGV